MTCELSKIKRYLELEPSYDDKIDINSHIDISSQVATKKVLKFLDSNSEIAFLVGKWGSGKTSTLKYIEKNNSFNFNFISFFGVLNVHEAQAKFVGFWFKLINIVIIFLIAYLIFPEIKKNNEFAEVLKLIITVFAGYIFFSNYRLRFILSYVFNYTLQIIGFLSNKIIVIEDLDRSSLDRQEIFSFLSNLPPLNGKYIVTLGYNSFDQLAEISEVATKINASLIFLNQDYHITFQTIAKLNSNIPFNTAGLWMAHIPLRMHLNIISNFFKNYSQLDEFEQKIILIEIYLEHLVLPLVPQGRDKSDFKLVYRNSFEVEVSSGIRLTPNESALLTSFSRSLDSSYLERNLEQRVPRSSRLSSNWKSVEYEKIIRYIISDNKIG